MSKLLKILIPIVSIIVVLLIAGYFLLTSFLTPARIQNLAQKMATETLQRPVEIGRVGLSIGFGIGITISDISVANIEGFRPGPMMKIKKTTLKLRLLPLLTRRVVINNIELQKLQANIEQNVNKEMNFAGLVPKETQDAGWRVSISNIRIRDSKIVYWNALTRTEYTVTDIDQLIKFHRSRIAISGKLTARIPEAKNIPGLDVSIRNVLEYDTLSKDVDIRNISVSTKSIKLKVSGVVEKSSVLRLDGKVNLDDLSKLTNLIPTSAQPEDMGGAIKGDFTINGTVEKPKIDGVFTLSNVRVTPKGMERGIERTNGTLSFGHESMEDISIQGNIGNTEFSITGAISDILSKNPTLDINAGLEGNLKDFQGITKAMKDISLSGSIQSEIRVQGTTRSPKYSGEVIVSEAMINGIGLEQPISNVNFNARLHGNTLKILSCKGRIGRSDFSFTGQVSDFKKPVIRLDNRSRYIDLDELIPHTKKGASTESKAVPLELNGTLNITRLTGMDMEFKNINTGFKYENGIIDIRDCRAQSFDGDVYLDFYYEINSPEPYKLSTRMQSVASQEILKRFLRFDRVQGKLSGKADFRGRGLDQKSVVSNLDATGNLSFNDGTFSNFPLLTKLLAWLGLKDYKNVQFHSMQGTFTIAKGQASIKDWTLSSRAGDFLTEGTIGLDGKLNLQVAATLSKSNSAIVKKYHGDWLLYVDKNGQAVVDMIVTGKTDAPAFRLDNNKIKQRLTGKVKDEFEERKKEFEKQIKDWLKWK
ncbi:MAG: AsmA-like C-terminal region-containing protein [bacterium]